MTTPEEQFKRKLDIAAAACDLDREKEALTAEHPQTHQCRPADPWYVWLFMAGRGAGKTWTGSYEVMQHLHDLKEKAWVTIVAPTINDVKLICLEGESGIYTKYQKEFVSYNRSELTLRHRSGGRVRALGAEKPDRLRGPQCSFLYGDELAVWPEASLDNAIMSLRLGDDPRALFTTTPRNKKFLRDLASAPDTILTSGTTYDNEFLPTVTTDYLRNRYEHTHKGRQELLGQLIGDIDGAFWRQEWIDNSRVSEAPNGFESIITIVDPATTANIKQAAAKGRESDETAAAVLGLKRENGKKHVYVLASDGYRLPPEKWAARVVDLHLKHEGSIIWYEPNQGGDMVKATINAAARGRTFVIKSLRATSRSKEDRAEPASVHYKNGVIHHVGVFAEAEDQMTSFPTGNDHDDRLDSIILGIDKLLSGPPKVTSRTVGPAPRRW